MKKRANKKFRGEPKYMQAAIAEARKNITSMDGGPFGACIVRKGKILAVARNTVLKNDASCHAEVNAIRMASKAAGTYDLSGSVIYTTTEPCPMCFGAIHWARIDTIVFGTFVTDSAKVGFNEMSICNASLKTLGKSKVELVPGFMLDDCESLLSDWSRTPGVTIY